MPPKNVLLFGEGSAEMGRAPRWDELPADPSPQEIEAAGGHQGAGEIILRRSMEAVLRIPPESIEVSSRSLKSVHKHHGGVTGKVLAAMTLARLDSAGYDGCCVMMDRDGIKSRPAEMEEGRRLAMEAGNQLPCSLGCPCETLEAWLLGDPKHLRQDYGARDVPARPEQLSGGPGAPQHPKTVLRQWVESGRYPDVARCISLDEVADRCPSYARFRNELAEQFGQA